MSYLFFSIIIPVYNAEKYIEDTIVSILDQKFSDYQIIIVNDGSTDNSKNIIENFAKKDNRIIIYNQENSGSVHARAFGLQQSQGEVIYFVDADDLLKPDTLAFIYNKMNNTDIDMLIFDYETFTDDGKIGSGQRLASNSRKMSKDEAYNLVLSGASINCLWRKAIKKDCFDVEIAMKYKRVMMADDLYLSLIPLTKAKNIFYECEVLYRYRIFPLSATKTFNTTYYQDVKIVLTELRKYLSQWNIQDQKIYFARILQSISSTICFSRTSVSGKKKQYYGMLNIIKEDPFFKEAYALGFKKIDFFRKIPLFCLGHNLLFMVLICKKISKIILRFKDSLK